MFGLGNESWSLERSYVDGKRVLVVGLGGGCDVISAFAVKEQLACQYEPKEIHFANTIGPRPLDNCKELFPNVYSLPEIRTPIDPAVSTYHTTLIEQSLPRDQYGSPYLFVVPHRDGGTINEITERNKNALLQGIMNLRSWDIIIGVDAGGDSLTGGIDYLKHPALGRDRQMLCILAQSGIPFYHFLLAPCCDGESSAELMESSVLKAKRKGLYCGWFSISKAMAKIMAEHSAELESKRTTNIMANAVFHMNENNIKDTLTIQRGIQPVIPVHWLTIILVFMWPTTMDPTALLPTINKL